MACHNCQFTPRLVETPARPTQIAIEDVVMCLMECGTTSIAGVQQSMHSLCIPIKPLFHPFTSLVSMLFTHRPSLHIWLAIKHILTNTSKLFAHETIAPPETSQLSNRPR